MILISWGIAFFEYFLQVPANRWGNSVYSVTQLKIIQEVITLAVFCAFAVLYLGEKIRWNYVAAFFSFLRRWLLRFGRRNKFCRSRGDEAHFFLNIETPYIVSYEAHFGFKSAWQREGLLFN